MRTVVAAAKATTEITVWVEGNWSFWRNMDFYSFCLVVIFLQRFWKMGWWPVGFVVDQSKQEELWSSHGGW